MATTENTTENTTDGSTDHSTDHLELPGTCVQCAIGAFVGAAVGDALGAPFEFLPAGVFAETNPGPRLGGIGEMRGGGTYSWRPAEFTDDTQMALALAASLLEQGGLDLADLWMRWRHWAAQAPDVGVQTGSVLRSDDHVGAAAAHHHRTGRSAGNGSVMRNAPIGILGARLTLDQVIALAIAQATLTHHDPHNGYAAAIHAGMIRAGVLGQDVFAAIDDVLDRLPSDARETWGPLLGADYEAVPDDPNGNVFTCLAQAVWAVRGATSFEDAVVRAVSLGLDTDTVAAVAGGIAGARWGIQAIPSRWTTYLNGRVGRGRDDAGELLADEYDYAALQAIARALVGKGPAPDQVADRPGGPTRVHDDVPLFAADLGGAMRATPDFAVISLCRTNGAFTEFPVRREVYLVDRPGPEHNADPLAVLEDVVATIDAFLTEDPERPVLVHCHGGRSRTALVLKAWAMRRHGWTEEEAHAWLEARWDRIDRTNPTFVDLLRNEWT
ncbi:MAG: ADP-ribosylglycohydrolase family protein [Actinomycetota bacterium]